MNAVQTLVVLVFFVKIFKKDFPGAAGRVQGDGV